MVNFQGSENRESASDILIYGRIHCCKSGCLINFTISAKKKIGTQSEKKDNSCARLNNKSIKIRRRKEIVRPYSFDSFLNLMCVIYIPIDFNWTRIVLVCARDRETDRRERISEILYITSNTYIERIIQYKCILSRNSVCAKFGFQPHGRYIEADIQRHTLSLVRALQNLIERSWTHRTTKSERRRYYILGQLPWTV